MEEILLFQKAKFSQTLRRDITRLDNSLYNKIHIIILDLSKTLTFIAMGKYL